MTAEFDVKLEIHKDDENFRIEIKVESEHAKDFLAVLLENSHEDQLRIEDNENREARIVIAGSIDDLPTYKNTEMESLLTDREHEIMENLLRGKYNKEIAFQLGLSINTVRSHMQNIFTKLGVDNRAEAIIIYLRRSGRLKCVHLLPDNLSA